MSRKFLLCLVFVVIFGLFLSGPGSNAWAAALPQEDPPPAPPDPLARIEEQIPYLPGAQQQTPDEVNTFPDPWGRMVSQKYIGVDFEIVITDGDGTNRVELTDNDAQDLYPKLNAGCTKIVFTSDRAGQAEIYTINPDGSGFTRLTNNGVHDIRPDWSKDGNRIIYQSQVDGQYDIFVMDASGANQTRLTADPAYDGQPVFSPDGSQIAFTSNRSGVFAIWVMNADGSNPVSLTGNLPYSELPFWSPDGSRIAFSADGDNDGWLETWKMNTDGSEQSMLVGSGSQRDSLASGWSPDGGYINYTIIHYVYYYGNWYWDYAYQYVLNVHLGHSTRVNQMEDRSWYMDWKSIDGIPPTSSMAGLPALSPAQFSVSWSGQDSQIGLKDFSVQYRDGVDGVWTNWLVHTASTSADFTGVGGHTYYFRVCAYDQAYNAEAWPANPQASTTVESQPPVSYLAPLPEFWRSNAITVTWSGVDIGNSGIAGYDLQYQDQTAGSEWVDWLNNTPATSAAFTGTYGHTYAFRLRGRDNALNVAPWSTSGNPQITLYAWAMSGQVFDNTGTPIIGALPDTSPAPFLSFPSGGYGAYAVYTTSNPTLKSASWARPGYGSLPDTDITYSADAFIDAYLPPADDIVQDGGFESGSLAPAWQTGGVYTPVLTSTTLHSGDYAALLGEALSFAPPQVILQYPSNHTPVIMDAFGSIHIASVILDSGQYKLFYLQRSADGAWLPLETVDQGLNQNYPPVMAVGTDGSVHLVWEKSGALYYTSRTPEGVWAANQVIPFCEPSFTILLTIDSNNTLHMLREISPGELFYNQHPQGGSWSAQETLSGYWHGGLGDFDMLITDAGEVHLINMQYDNVLYASRGVDGVWSDTQSIQHDLLLNCTTVQLRPEVNGDISLFATCMDQLITLRRNAAGVWSTPVNLLPGVVVDDYDIQIDSQGLLHLAVIERWQYVPPYLSHIYYMRQENSTGWTLPYAVDETGVSLAEARIAVSEAGQVMIIWYRNEEGIFISNLNNGDWSDPIRLHPDFGFDPFFAITPSGEPNFIFKQYPDLLYIGLTPADATGNARLSQTLTLTPSLEAPVLSFLYQMNGASATAGSGFSVQVSDGISATTLLSATANSPDWQHAWFDLSPWLSQAVTLTFQTRQVQGYPTVAVYLDEVSLGSAYPDTWMQLSGSPASALPGEQITLLLQYGNRGGMAASGVSLELTLPDGINFIDASLPPGSAAAQTLHWDIGDLPARGATEVITLTVELDSAAPMATELSVSASISASRELESANNSDCFILFSGERIFMPMLRR